MKLEIEWGHTFNVEKREPQLNVTIVYEVGVRRIKSEQSFSRSVIEAMPKGLSIFEVIRVAAGAMLAARSAIEDKRKRVARAALMDAAMAGSLGAHMLEQRPNGKDRRLLH